MDLVTLLAICHHLLGITFIILQMVNRGNKDEK